MISASSFQSDRTGLLRLALALAVLGLSVSAMQAQPEELVDMFERREHPSDSLTLPYRLFVPSNYDSNREYPLVLSMHGSGERGVDNERHIASHRLATAWADPANQSRWPAFVVAPQAPPRGTWAAPWNLNDSTLNPISAELYTVVSLLDSLAREFSIDPDRVYATGLSMGGFGVFDLTARFPERFAAAIPMSGGYTPTAIRLYGDLPFWIFHGEVDGTVPSVWSRRMVEAFIDIGREAMFTDCGIVASDCGRISDAAFAKGVTSHVDVIYTGYPSGGHVIWEESYDDPRLAPWVFSRHRLLRDGIQITDPAGYPIWSGNQTVSWNVTAPDETGELWFSNDNGESWSLVDSTVTNDGSQQLSLDSFADAAFAKVRLVFYDADGFVHKKEESDAFTVDGPADGAPFLRLDDRPFRGRPVVEDTLVNLQVLAGDPERAELDLTVYSSIDGGLTFGEIESLPISPSNSIQPITIDLSMLPNTDNAVFKVEVSDGSATTSERTSSFIKSTPRTSSDFVEQVEGDGVAQIRINWVDPAALTGHRYRITFDDNRPSASSYTVIDTETGQIVLEDEPVSDGITESALFDGIRLVVAVSRRAEIDLEATGWRSDETELEVTVSAPTVNTPDGPIRLLATPADYEIEITESVSDTSAALFGFERNPMRFAVRKTSGEPVEILFNDRNSDGWPSPQEFIYLLEPSSATKLGDVSASTELAWFLSFGGDEQTTLPAPGDIFDLRTIKPATDQDVFEFDAVIGLATDDPPPLPDAIGQVSNYPNPFSGSTNISFEISTSSLVSIKIYSMLGREVGAFELGWLSPGVHLKSWEAASAEGRSFPSGSYLYRIIATDPHSGLRSISDGRMMLIH